MPDSLAVILPAAGRATRFGKNKLVEPLSGTAVIARSIAPFLRRSDVIRIIIATEDPVPLRDAINRSSALDGRISFCNGGASRAHSVRGALSSVPPDAEWVAVHDAARPLVSDELIERTFAAARRHGAAAPALPVTLTIKQAAGPLPAMVQKTLPRHELWAMQTPQIMRRIDLEQAFERCTIPLEEVTDDVQLLEMISLPVWLVEGEARNIKITTLDDMKFAESQFAPGKPGG